MLDIIMACIRGVSQKSYKFPVLEYFRVHFIKTGSLIFFVDTIASWFHEPGSKL